VQRLTIVIPAWGQEDRFEATLLSVLENRPGNCEILVPHCGDYEDPYSLSDEVTFIEQADAATGTALLNAAARAARAPVVHVLSAGATVGENWTDSALDRFDDKLLGSVSPLVVDANQQRIIASGVGYTAGGTRRLVASGKNFRPEKPPRKRIAGPSLLAGFYRREALYEVGGWHAAVGDHLADVDLALSLEAIGWTTEFDAGSMVSYDQVPAQPAPSFQQAWLAERLFWRHAATVGWGKSLLLHPAAVAWESLAALPTAAGLTQPLARLLAAVELPRNLSHQRKLLDEAYSIAANDDGDASAILPFPGKPKGGAAPPLTKAS